MLTGNNAYYKDMERLRKELRRCNKAAKRAERDGDFIKLGQIKMAEQDIRNELEGLSDYDPS